MLILIGICGRVNPAQAPLPIREQGHLAGCVCILGLLLHFASCLLVENSVSGSCKVLKDGSVAESWDATKLLGTDCLMPACQETRMCMSELCLKPAFMVTCQLVVARPCGRSPFAFSHLQRPPTSNDKNKFGKGDLATHGYGFYPASLKEGILIPEPRAEDKIRLLCHK